MNCADVQPLASNYLDGELPEELSDRVQRHLLGCPACRQEIESVRMAVEVLSGTHRPAQAGEEFIQSALANLAAELDVTTRLPEPSGQLVLGIGYGNERGTRREEAAPLGAKSRHQAIITP